MAYLHRRRSDPTIPTDVYEPPAAELQNGYTPDTGRAIIAVEYIGIIPAGVRVTVIPSEDDDDTVRTVTLKPDRVMVCEIDRIRWQTATLDHQIRVYMARDDRAT